MVNALILLGYLQIEINTKSFSIIEETQDKLALENHLQNHMFNYQRIYE